MTHPPIDPAVQAALDRGYTVTITTKDLPAVTESATATGPGLKASGKEVATDFRADAPIVELDGASASGGNTESVGSVLGYDIDSKQLELAAIGLGGILVIYAVILGKRGDMRGAGLAALAGACLIAGAFYPLAFLAAAVVGLLWLTRSSWSASALPKVRKTLGVVTNRIEDDKENGPPLKRGIAKDAKRAGVDRVLDKELTKAGVK